MTPSSLSELTPIISYMDFTHFSPDVINLGSLINIYIKQNNCKFKNLQNVFFIWNITLQCRLYGSYIISKKYEKNFIQKYYSKNKTITEL